LIDTWTAAEHARVMTLFASRLILNFVISQITYTSIATLNSILYTFIAHSTIIIVFSITLVTTKLARRTDKIASSFFIVMISTNTSGTTKSS